MSLEHYRDLENLHRCEILVVLNHCTDHSEQIVKHHQSILPNLRYCKEEHTGLSIARNRAYQEAFADFVFYIDDDAYPEKDSISKLLNYKYNGYKAVTGRTKLWNDEHRWILKEFVETPSFLEKAATLPEGGFINGCCMGFERGLLLDIGGFNTELGMKGDYIAYAEEVELQQRLRMQNIEILFDPELIVCHKSHFTTVKGFLTSAFLKGRYAQKINPHAKFNHFAKFGLYSFIGALRLIPYALLYGYKAAMVKSFAPSTYHLGRII